MLKKDLAEDTKKDNKILNKIWVKTDKNQLVDSSGNQDYKELDT